MSSQRSLSTKGRSYNCPHFTDEEPEPQVDYVILLIIKLVEQEARSQLVYSVPIFIFSTTIAFHNYFPARFSLKECELLGIRVLPESSKFHYQILNHSFINPKLCTDYLLCDRDFSRDLGILWSILHTVPVSWRLVCSGKESLGKRLCIN